MLDPPGATVVHGPVMQTELLRRCAATLEATRRALLGTGRRDRAQHGHRHCGRGSASARASASTTRPADGRPGPRWWLAVRRRAARRWATGWRSTGRHPARPARRCSTSCAAPRRRRSAGRRAARRGRPPHVADALAGLGAEVIDVPVYRWHPPDDAGPGHAPARRGRRRSAPRRDVHLRLRGGQRLRPGHDPAALRTALDGRWRPWRSGPCHADALRQHGVEAVVEPGRARLGAMVQALVRSVSARHGCCGPTATRARWQGDLLVGHGAHRQLTGGEARLLERARGPSTVGRRQGRAGGRWRRRPRRRGRRRPPAGQARPARRRHPVGPPPRLRLRPRGRPAVLSGDLGSGGGRVAGSAVGGAGRRR